MICFSLGTVIGTSRGEVAVQNLREGDRVITRDNGLQPLNWLGRRQMSGRALLQAPHLRPVLIRKGAFGRGLPEHDMMVSPNQRMVVASDRSSLFFAGREALISAKHLINHRDIQQIDSTGISYFHMLFDRHEVVLVNGTWSESFHPGDYSLNGVGNAQRGEFFELFPEMKKPVIPELALPVRDPAHKSPIRRLFGHQSF